MHNLLRVFEATSFELHYKSMLLSSLILLLLSNSKPVSLVCDVHI